MYRLAGRHVAATGVFFRLEPEDTPPGIAVVPDDGPTSAPADSSATLSAGGAS